MKTLKDYELIRGDWVKFADGQGWKEFDAMTNYYWFSNVSYSPSYEVEAVLRPSFIVRDRLDAYLEEIKVYPYGEAQPLAMSGDGVCLHFKQIHPKEEKKSFQDEIYNMLPRADYPVNETFNTILLKIAAKIDKLKNKETEG